MIEQERIESGILTTHLIKQGRSSSSDGADDEKTSSNQTNPSSVISPVLLLSTLVSVCGSLCYGCAMGYSSPAQSAIMEELGLSVADYSVFASIMTFGGMISAAVSGKIAALFGRRRTMWVSEIFCTTGWLAIAFAKNAMLLDLGRLFVGFGVGIISYVVPVYIAEITPKNIRGSFTFSNQLTQSIGLSSVFVLGNFVHWRTLAIIGAIPCILQVIGLFFIPESPRWLATYGRERELEATLQRLRGSNANIHDEAADIKDIVEVWKRGSKGGILQLFQMKYAYSLIVGVGLMVLQQLCGSSAITSYANRIFEKANFPSDVGTTILASVMVPKSVLVLLTVDRWGRRPLLLASSIGVCICSFFLGLSCHFQKSGQFQQITSVLLLVGILGYVAAFAIGLGGLPWVIMSEIFPINVKVSAGSLVTVANWFFSWVIVYSFNFMMQWSPSGTFFIFSGVSLITILFVGFLVPETKGRTLEEIQASIARFGQ